MSIKDELGRLEEMMKEKERLANYHHEKAKWYFETGDYVSSDCELNTAISLLREIMVLVDEKCKLNQKNT